MHALFASRMMRDLYAGLVAEGFSQSQSLAMIKKVAAARTMRPEPADDQTHGGAA